MNEPNKPSIKQQLLSRKFGGAVAVFATSTAFLVYLVVLKCNTPSGFEYGPALSFFDSWVECNLWNVAIFGGADILEKSAPYLKRNKTTNE